MMKNQTPLKPMLSYVFSAIHTGAPSEEERDGCRFVYSRFPKGVIPDGMKLVYSPVFAACKKTGEVLRGDEDDVVDMMTSVVQKRKTGVKVPFPLIVDNGMPLKVGDWFDAVIKEALDEVFDYGMRYLYAVTVNAFGDGEDIHRTTVDVRCSMLQVLTLEEVAEKLDGVEYMHEMDRVDESELKKARIVVAFGASDDLMEFRGAIRDEVDVPGSSSVFLDENGVVRPPDCCNASDRCELFQERKQKSRKIDAVWGGHDPQYPGGISWMYRTLIPHFNFTVFDDGEPYCQGIVFSMDDLG